MKKVFLVLLVLILATLACNSESGGDTSGPSDGDSGSGDAGDTGGDGDASAGETRGPADPPELPAATSDSIATGRFTADVFAEIGFCIMNLGFRTAEDSSSLSNINVNATTRLVSRPVSDINLEQGLVVPIEDGVFTFEGFNAEVTLTIVGQFTSDTTFSGYYSLMDDEGNGCQNIAFEGELSE